MRVCMLSKTYDAEIAEVRKPSDDSTFLSEAGI
jgi:hypothetical protein